MKLLKFFGLILLLVVGLMPFGLGVSIPANSIDKIDLKMDLGVSKPVKPVDKPTFGELSDQKVEPGETLQFYITATGEGKLLLGKEKGPGELKVTQSAYGSAKGIFTWTPEVKDIGTHQVTFKVEDYTYQLETSKTVMISVGEKYQIQKKKVDQLKDDYDYASKLFNNLKTEADKLIEKTKGKVANEKEKSQAWNLVEGLEKAKERFISLEKKIKAAKEETKFQSLKKELIDLGAKTESKTKEIDSLITSLEKIAKKYNLYQEQASELNNLKKNYEDVRKEYKKLLLEANQLLEKVAGKKISSGEEKEAADLIKKFEENKIRFNDLLDQIGKAHITFADLGKELLKLRDDINKNIKLIDQKIAELGKIKAAPLNHPPTFKEIETGYEIREGKSKEISISADDEDGDKLDFYLGPTTSKDYFSLKDYKDNTITLVFKGSKEVGKEYKAEVIVKDKETSVSKEFTFKIIKNTAPKFVDLTDKGVKEGEKLEFEVKAEDIDNDELSFSVTNLPAGATFENQKFSWVPDFNQAGAYDVTFRVKDDLAETSQTIKITVEDVPQPKPKTEAEKVKELKDKFADYEDEYDEIKDNLEETTKESKKKNLLDDLDDLDDDLKDLRKEAKKLKSEITDKDLKDELDELIDDIDDLRENIKNLKDKYTGKKKEEKPEEEKITGLFEKEEKKLVEDQAEKEKVHIITQYLPAADEAVEEKTEISWLPYMALILGIVLVIILIFVLALALRR